MKKNIWRLGKIGLLLLALLGVLWFPGDRQVYAASAKSSYKRAITYYKKKQYTKANKVFRRLPKNISDAKAGKRTAKMKKAYRRVLNAYSKDMFGSKDYIWGYYLTDINKDNKPELLVKFGTCEADARLRIYTYKNGKAKRVKTIYCSHSGFYAYPVGNGVIMHQAHMGYETVSLITMVNGKVRIKSLGSRETSNYTSFPYSLNAHVRSYSGGKVRLNYSPL